MNALLREDNPLTPLVDPQEAKIFRAGEDGRREKTHPDSKIWRIHSINADSYYRDSADRHIRKDATRG